MSWLDKIKTDLIIQTGDGKKYKPQWLNASKEKEYNVSVFEFPNVAGSLVDRRKPKGVKYNLELYFQGDEHLTEAGDFETSADDSRPWTLTHPFYGLLLVQPLSLASDNTQYNVTKITVPVVETLGTIFPKGVTNPKNQIAQTAEVARTTLAASYGNNAKPTARDINLQQNYIQAAFNIANNFTTPDLAADLFDAYNLALTLVTAAATAPLKAIASFQKLLALPAQFATTAKQRFTVLGGTFNSLRGGVATASSTGSSVPKAQKIAYQANNGTVLTAMAETASTPQAEDYTTRNDVLQTMELLIGYYNQYIADLDFLQTATGGTPDSFIPDAEALTQLELLINYTISNLFTLALDAKQERSFILLEDTNCINLTHKLYGLDEADVNITKLINQNNFGLKHMLQIEKNTRIYYYV